MGIVLISSVGLCVLQTAARPSRRDWAGADHCWRFVVNLFRNPFRIDFVTVPASSDFLLCQNNVKRLCVALRRGGERGASRPCPKRFECPSLSFISSQSGGAPINGHSHRRLGREYPREHQCRRPGDLSRRHAHDDRRCAEHRSGDQGDDGDAAGAGARPEPKPGWPRPTCSPGGATRITARSPTKSSSASPSGSGRAWA